MAAKKPPAKKASAKKPVGRLPGQKAKTIPRHPKRAEIEKGLIEGKPIRQLEREYGVPKATLSDYKARDLAAPVAAYRLEQFRTHEAILDRNEAVLALGMKMLAACDEWLTDPERPDRYLLAPRSDEIDVVYTECNGNGNEVKAKGKLQDLLARVAGGIDGDVVSVQIKQMDNRKLLLEASANIRQALEFNARILKIVQDTPGSAPNIGAQIGSLIQIIHEATKGSPAIREKIISGMEKALATDVD